MAFNLDHTANGNLSLGGSYAAFTGSFTFPTPAVPGSSVTFLAEESADISSISGLQSCLDLLVPNNEVGTASTLDAGNTQYSAIVINNDNLIDDSLLPDAICSCVFVVTNSGQLTLLNQAKKGSLAMTANPYQTYVLTDGLFNNISNWTPLLNPDNCVDSVNMQTGTVLISGKDLSSAVGYSGTVESGVQYLYECLVSQTCLSDNYKTESDFEMDIMPYATTSYLSNELNSYATTQCVSDCLSFYTDNNGTGSLFSPHALAYGFGTASQSQHNVGTAGSCILCVGSDGFLDSSVLPDVSLVESFNINSSSELTSLSTATLGDVAFDVVNKFNYILVSSGENAYQDSNNWIRMSAEEGSLLSVNGHTAAPNGIVTVYGSDLCGVNTANSIINATSTISPVPLPVDNSLIGTTVSFNVSTDSVITQNDYVKILDQESWSNFYYYGQVLTTQVTGPFTLQVNINVLSNGGFSSVPSDNWKIHLITNLKDNINNLDTFIQLVEANYQSSGSFISDRSDYMTVVDFDSAADLKAISGHAHPTSDVTDLDTCLSDISAFKAANTIGGDKSYSHKLDDNSSTVSCGSLVLGKDGKAKNNYSLVQSAGKFSQNGDAQYSLMAGKVLPADNNWTSIVNVGMEKNSIALLNAGFVSRQGDSFTLEGVVVRESSSVQLPEDLAKAIYSTGSYGNDVRVCAGTSGFALQVQGQTYWTSSLEMVYTKSSGVAEDDGVGQYWQALNGNNWYNVTGNWFTENTFTDHATSLPSGTTNVQMVGSTAAIVNIDCADWVQPNSIDTTQIAQADGICIVSNTSAIFNGQIYGNAEFFGAIFM